MIAAGGCGGGALTEDSRETGRGGGGGGGEPRDGELGNVGGRLEHTQPGLGEASAEADRDGRVRFQHRVVGLLFHLVSLVQVDHQYILLYKHIVNLLSSL